MLTLFCFNVFVWYCPLCLFQDLRNQLHEKEREQLHSRSSMDSSLSQVWIAKSVVNDFLWTPVLLSSRNIHTPYGRDLFYNPPPPPPCGSPKLTLYIALHFFKTLPPPLQFLIWIFFWNYTLVNGSRSTKHSHLAPVVQTLDSAIHRINQYPADKY